VINIAYVIDTIESPTGGTEKQLLLMLEHLDRTKFSPVLCVLHSSEWLEKYFDLCPMHALNITSYRHLTTIGRFWHFVRFLKSRDIDIVHTFFKEGMRIGITAAKLAGVQRIISVRRSQGYWMTPFDLKVTKILNRWVDLIISNSSNTKTWVSEVEGVSVDKIDVIHNGIDLNPFISIPGNIRYQYRNSLSIPENAPVVGIVANLRPVKAIDVFIRAAQLIRKAIPAAHFVIVGDGDLEEGLKQLAADLGVSDYVHFLGRRHDIPQILSTLDIGVLSSTSESFSNTIVEYMAAGLPVVCTDVGGAREAVEDGENGFVAPVGDYKNMSEKIINIFLNDRTKSLGKESRRKALVFFSLESMMLKYEKLYLSDLVRI